MRIRLIAVTALAAAGLVAVGAAALAGTFSTTGIEPFSSDFSASLVSFSAATCTKGARTYKGAREVWSGTATSSNQNYSGNLQVSLVSLRETDPSGTTLIGGKSTGTLVITDPGTGATKGTFTIVGVLSPPSYTEGVVQGKLVAPLRGSLLANFASVVDSPNHLIGKIGAPLAGQPENSAMTFTRASCPPPPALR